MSCMKCWLGDIYIQLCSSSTCIYWLPLVFYPWLQSSGYIRLQAVMKMTWSTWQPPIVCYQKSIRCWSEVLFFSYSNWHLKPGVLGSIPTDCWPKSLESLDWTARLVGLMKHTTCNVNIGFSYFGRMWSTNDLTSHHSHIEWTNPASILTLHLQVCC